MKQKQIGEYRPKYPKKLLRSAILAAAAAVAVTGTTGCDMLRTGGVPEPVPTDELVLDGEIAIDPGENDPTLLGGAPLPEPTDELILEGEIAVDPGEEPDGSGREEPALEGKIIVPEDTSEP